MFTRSRTKSFFALAGLGVAIFIFGLWSSLLSSPKPRIEVTIDIETSQPTTEYLVDTIENTSKYFLDYPLGDDKFGEMGRRVDILGDWLRMSVEPKFNLQEREIITTQAERLAQSLFPFLPQSFISTHFGNVSSESRGIVIPSGVATFRYACHLVSCLREVLHSTVPIQIVYAGDTDLPSSYREIIVSLAPEVETLDILTVFNDNNLAFWKSGWAIKPFAILASKFQHVLLLDADAVFLQPPETIFESHEGYHETGTLLFHDRLLWKGHFQDRHKWWREQMKHRQPSDTLLKSLVYTEDYAEEGDSGVVVMDKGRLPVLLGLLHTCWQNTLSVREKWTYRLTYGDKESWWFGFELTGAPYSFEAHYGSIVGSTVHHEGNASEVCGFTIAHLDYRDRLLWYNGSLLKNKKVDAMEFEVPTHWMTDGVWWKGSDRSEMSCMSETILRTLDATEIGILEESVRIAQEVDQRLRQEEEREIDLEGN